MKKILALIVIFMFSVVIQAQIYFPQPRSIILNGSTNEALLVISADIDGDGDMDIIAASKGEGKLSLYENIDGHGNFGTQKVLTVSKGTISSIKTTDLNQDGFLDIILTTRTDNYVFWYENDGNGNFSSSKTVGSLSGVTSAVAADFDGDGDLDVVATSDYAKKIVWFENTGNENFGPRQNIATYVASDAVYAADINYDGDMDFIANTGNGITGFDNYGFAFFSQITIEDNYSVNTSQSLYPADIDNDGYVDILASGSASVVWYKKRDSLWDFSSRKDVIHYINNIYSVYPADIDGDGDLDVLFTGADDNMVAWCENTDGNGTFSDKKIISTEAEGARSVYASDLDGDGDLDVISASMDDNKIAWYKNDGTGNFGEQIVITRGIFEPRAVFSADIDNDGDLDVLSASARDNRIAWYENLDGLGNFGIQKSITTEAKGANCVFPADLDGDGDLDVLSSSWDDGKIAWYENLDGQGDFGNQQVLQISYKATRVIAADLDNDNDLDVLYSAFQTDKVAWFENDGNGNFSAEKIITTSADEAYFVYTADIDSDGDIDVLSASVGDDKIAWYENDGNGNFSSEKIISTEADRPTIVYADDIDSDGDIDVLAASVGNKKIYWFENLDGSGTFQIHVAASFIDAPAYLRTADLDNDGDVDIITGITYHFHIWLENDGHQNFTPYHRTTTSNYPEDGFPADIDGDGYCDIVSANCGLLLNNTIAWQKNSILTFTQPQTQTVCPNSEVIFSVSAPDSIDDFRWQCDTGAGFEYIFTNSIYSGVYDDTLIISSANPDMDGYVFRCLVSSQRIRSDSAILHVIDTITPVITSTHNDTIFYAGSNCSVVLPDFTQDVRATDDCATSLDIIQYPPAGTDIFGDTNIITLRATDDVGNYEEVSFNVQIIDTIKPAISSVNDKIIDADDNCQATLPDYTIDLTVSDNCDTSLVILQTPAAGTIISGALNTIILKAIDDAGNSDSIFFNVSVEDTTAPQINSEHTDIVIGDGINCEAALPDYTSSVVAVDNCDSELDVSQIPAPGTIISGDINLITLKVTDDDGNSSQVSFNAAVADTSKPIISSTINDQIINADNNCQATLPDYTFDITATDNCDDNLEILQIPDSGTVISGTQNTVTLKVTDDAGNSDSITFNVSVEDSTPPSIVCIDDVTITLNEGQNTYLVSDNSLNPLLTDDNCEINSVQNNYNLSPTLNGAEFPVGTTNIVWTILDYAGNTNNCSFTLTVKAFSGTETLSKNNISVYPNPTNDIIFIEFGKNNITNVSILDITGKVIIEKNDISQRQMIDISDFTKGIYLLKVQTSDNVFMTKIIKE